MYKSKLISLWICLNRLVPEDHSHTAGSSPHLNREHPFISLHFIHHLSDTAQLRQVPQAVIWEVPTSKLLSPVTRSPVGCNYEPPCSPERAPAALPCAAARDLSASAYQDRLHWNFILWISPWNTDILPLEGSTENVAQCTERQKKARAAGLAGAESPLAKHPILSSDQKLIPKARVRTGKCLLWIPTTSLLPALPEVSLHFKLFHPSGTASNMSWPCFCTLPHQMIYLSHLFIYTHIFITVIHLSLLHFCLLSSNYKTDWIQLLWRALKCYVPTGSRL